MRGRAVIWQVAAIVAIVLATFIWFVRDEQNTKRSKLDRQAHYFAHAPQYRYEPRAALPVIPPKARTGSLLRNDQDFFEAYLSRRAKA